MTARPTGKRRVALLIATLSILSIGSCTKRLPYTPASGVTKAVATADVRRFLEEQSPKYAPSSVEILPEKIAFTRNAMRRSLLFTSIVSRPEISKLCLDNIGATELSQKGDRFEVDEFDPDGQHFLRAISGNAEKSRRFIDALESLRSSPR